jgi:acetyltransferase-like isoleucine patch superfamily enzyme
MQLVTRIWFKFLKQWWKISVPFRLRMKGLVIGKNVIFYGMPIVSVVSGSRIIIGDRAVLCSDSRFTALGVNHPVVLRTIRSGAEIIIGADSGLSGTSICSAMSVVLGRECLIGANVTIVDTDFHAIRPEGRRYNNNINEISASPVRVEDNVFIGAGALILKGVSVGRNCVIGAGSVAVKNVPADRILVSAANRLL